jgi:arsenate reductase
MMGVDPTGVLFLCVANSARSQMAEGFARTMAPPGVAIYSAGSAPGGLNQYAVRVMAELGIDITGQRSKSTDEIPKGEIGTVVTLCAEEVCPVFPGNVRRFHWPVQDPVAAAGADEEIIVGFRRVRDQIKSLVSKVFPQNRGG